MIENKNSLNDAVFIRRTEPEKRAVKIVAGGKILELKEDS